MAIPINGGKSPRLEYSRLNRACGCFAFLGLATLPVGVLAVLDEFGLMNSKTLAGWVELFEFTLAIPLFVVMVIVSMYGIVRTVQLRHPALVVLSAVSIVCGAGYVLLLLTVWDGGRGVLGDVATVAFGIYITANVLIPAWWFTKGRRRYRGKAFAQE